jgi:hypothetical protein
MLQQLRGLHAPSAPGWWPPAPGWWLLALLLLVCVYFVSRLMIRRWKKAQPWRHAGRIYADLHAEYLNEAIDNATYVHRTNELLKRLLIHADHLGDARRATDTGWLALLESRFGSEGFIDGPGTVLGNGRFTPEFESDAAAFDAGAFDALVRRCLTTVKP